MKSSSCAGTAHKPICWSWAERLLPRVVAFVFVAVVLGAGEFIISLQVLRADVERLGLRMVAKVERNQCGARLASKQESDGGRARRVALQSFYDGAAQC